MKTLDKAALVRRPVHGCPRGIVATRGADYTTPHIRRKDKWQLEKTCIQARG